MRPSNNRKNDRGSVIVMAVGVLTLLFMLGATYLIVSFGDQREATSIAAGAPVRKVAQGLQTKVAARLVEDLYFNADVVASQFPFETANTWQHCVDFAGEGVDRWLASAYVENGVYRHATNLFPIDATPDNRFIDVPVLAYSGKPVNNGGRWLVDTDGDGWTDSVLVFTGISDERGNSYFAAVRVVDLCAMVNVNTAYKPGATVPYGALAPVSGEPIRGNPLSDVNIEALPGISAAGVHQARVSASGESIESYNNRYIACALNQDPAEAVMPYRPFCMDDAMALLWRETAAGSTNYTVRGRIKDVLTEAVVLNDRPFLTPWSSSRRLPMQVVRGGPDGNANYDNFALGFAIDANWAVTDPNGKLALMQAYFNAIPPGAPGLTEAGGALDNVTNKRLRLLYAAHLAANHIDFADDERDVNGNPLDKITVITTNAEGGQLTDASGAPTVVFGIERQPFITELFLKKHLEDPALPPTIYSAIELYNPYASAISLADYRLKVGNNLPVAVGFPANLAAGGRLVIRSHDDTKIPVAAAAVAVTAAELDLSQACKIVRQVTVGAQTYSVVMGSATLTVADPMGANETAFKTVQRDDAPSRARYSVAKYRDANNDYTSNLVAGGNAAAATTNLGLANGLAGTELEVKWIQPAPIYVRNGGFVNLGDLYRLYLLGPDLTKALDEYLEPEFGEVTNGRLKTKDVTGMYRWESQTVPGDYYLGFSMLSKAAPSCLLSRFFTVNSPAFDKIDNDFDFQIDALDLGGERAIYGAINLNTAPKEVLLALPYMTAALADAIITYRNSKPAGAPLVSAAEVLYPLWNNQGLAKSDSYAAGAPNYKIADGKTSDDGLCKAGEEIAGDMAKVQTLYARWSNLLTVRSDSFAAYITVMRFSKTDTQAANFVNPTAVKRYVSILDRSQCNRRSQPVLTLMSAQID